ncbi:RHS repeat-associated core domain-containing protein [Pseudodesulfovibrio indicus]|uniref:RHS repeat domain-containing protein n=1 Tax=Pseudodesulfovibrio indicus TaxID=1716143 RepID=UPI00292CD145|nr:RHS repeat-associated core domain-containing protein [Pseudodesulfovibrio indicus]
MAGLFYGQVGSLRLIVDMHDNVIKEIVYDPFGGIIEDTNPGFRIPLGFAGGLHDRDLGFVRFGWRDYDVRTGRWTAPDPIGDRGGDPDWYGYCLDDPVNAVDPAGLEAKKGAGRRIVTNGLIEGGKGVAFGGATMGLPGAVAGGMIMTPVGMLKGVLKEYPPVRQQLDKIEKKLLYELTDGKAERMKKTRLPDYEDKQE